MADPQPPADAADELDRLTAEIAAIGFVLPGTTMKRYTRCTSKNCRCQADPPQLHGPYIQWTRKVAGKTVTRRLSKDQLQRYQPWFDNAKRLRELTAELEALSLRTAEHAEGWDPKP
jgi:hypothetical protein